MLPSRNAVAYEKGINKKMIEQKNKVPPILALPSLDAISCTPWPKAFKVGFRIVV